MLSRHPEWEHTAQAEPADPWADSDHLGGWAAPPELLLFFKI